MWQLHSHRTALHASSVQQSILWVSSFDPFEWSRWRATIPQSLPGKRFWVVPVCQFQAHLDWNSANNINYIIEISFWKHLLKNFFLIFFFFWIQQIICKIAIIIMIPTMSTTTTAEMLIAIFTTKICSWVLPVFMTRVSTHQWFCRIKYRQGRSRTSNVSDVTDFGELNRIRTELFCCC